MVLIPLFFILSRASEFTAWPDVTHAAVVGIADGQQGEIPCALLVSASEPYLPADQIRAQLVPLLAKNELPEMILFCDKLPMTASGKPDKQAIKSLFTH